MRLPHRGSSCACAACSDQAMELTSRSRAGNTPDSPEHPTATRSMRVQSPVCGPSWRTWRAWRDAIGRHPGRLSRQERKAAKKDTIPKLDALEFHVERPEVRPAEPRFVYVVQDGLTTPPGSERRRRAAPRQEEPAAVAVTAAGNAHPVSSSRMGRAVRWLSQNQMCMETKCVALSPIPPVYA